ncbi:DUF1552 domain-containing protein [Solimonas marina]|uniref:DUF1552 domain-containing protein n=1 Tax=Solimonas marina TaxID=2714601 RepID=A0A969WA89_9GAMM|nr:DUF1552 domain-containing protein [Solimonas marina]NKF22323.1 DUF1552 domain-containing protein [Solimonas marina]
MKVKNLSRRHVLRGILNGGVVAVALPVLDCLLDDNGKAWASTGEALPVRFGTWFWGLGATNRIFVPEKVGAGYEIPSQLAPVGRVQQHVNLITNLNAFRDGEPNLCHYSGWIIGRTGKAPKSSAEQPGETLDITVANQIGRTTRFRTLTASATGDFRNTVSYENANSPNPPEISPLEFYTRLFGADFQDPNAPTFTPNPRIMVRRSVLSGVLDEIKSMQKTVGAADRQRLDEYFTGLRHLEKQFDQQLTKPEPIAACHAPPVITQDPKMGVEVEQVEKRHRMLTDLMVMAVACDQTRVFNMAYSNAQANTVKEGYEKPHHTTTHEEPIDGALHYQPQCAYFSSRAIEEWAYFVEAFSKIREGSGSLLDNMLIYANTDHGEARIHSLNNMVAFTAGRAGGRVKTGLHVDAGATGVTRVGFTAMRAMGVDLPNWGVKSNMTDKAFSEILV